MSSREFLKHWSREKGKGKRKENIKDSRGGCFFLKKEDLNHTIILCCNIKSCRERERKGKVLKETQIAKCDSDWSNKSLLMTTNPAEGVGIKSIRVSGVATHPMTIKVRVFGPMN
jgi:hypothetical protein